MGADILSNMTMNVLAGILAALALPLIVWSFIRLRDQILPPWSPWRKKVFEPTLEGAKDLEQAIALLGDMQAWLSTDQEISAHLWHIVDNLNTERLTCLVYYHKEVKEQIWALRQLSQIDSDRAKKVSETILKNQVHSDEKLKSVAEKILTQVTT